MPETENSEITKKTRRITMLDPRTKIVILLLISIFSFSGSGQLLTEAIGIFLICFIMLLYGYYTSCIKCLAAYSLVFGLVLICAGSPNIITAMMSVTLVMIRKMMSIIMFSSFLIATTTVGETIAALQKMKVPKNVIIPTVVMIRFFPTLSDEYHHILAAMKIRGIRISVKNIILHPLRLCEYILVPMILRLSTISDELSAAAVSRGIDAEIERTSYYEVKLHYVDLVFTLLFLALTIFTIAGGMEVFR